MVEVTAESTRPALPSQLLTGPSSTVAKQEGDTQCMRHPKDSDEHLILFTENESKNRQNGPAFTGKGSCLQKLPCIPPDMVHLSQDSPMPGILAWGQVHGP